MAPELVLAWGGDVAVTYGASGTLRRQVEGGAPIDAVMFASAAPVDSLIEQQLVDPTTRRRVATNALVLIGQPSTKVTWATLPELPADQKLAVGDPGAVPAGRYAREALQGLGTWDGLQDRIVYAGDVAMVLAYARRGEVAAAVVYSTDVRGIEDVAILDRASWPGAPTPEVLVAATVGSAPSARDFLDFVASPAGQAILQRHGFGPP